MTSGQRSIVSGPHSSTCGCSARATGRWSSGCYRQPAPDRANSTSQLNSMRDLPLLRNAMVPAFEAIRVADFGSIVERLTRSSVHLPMNSTEQSRRAVPL